MADGDAEEATKTAPKQGRLKRGARPSARGLAACRSNALSVSTCTCLSGTSATAGCWLPRCLMRFPSARPACLLVKNHVGC